MIILSDIFFRNRQFRNILETRKKVGQRMHYSGQPLLANILRAYSHQVGLIDETRGKTRRSRIFADCGRLKFFLTR